MRHGLRHHVLVNVFGFAIRVSGILGVFQSRQQLMAIEGVVEPVFQKLLEERTLRVIIENPQMRDPETNDQFSIDEFDARELNVAAQVAQELGDVGHYIFFFFFFVFVESQRAMERRHVVVCDAH